MSQLEEILIVGILVVMVVFLFPLNFIVLFAPMIPFSVWQSSLKWLDEFLKDYLALSRLVPFFRMQDINTYIYLGVVTWLASLVLLVITLFYVFHSKKRGDE